MNSQILKYLSDIGRNGGKKSRRYLSADDAKSMVRIREARKLFKKYHARCFWSFDPNYQIQKGDLRWVSEQLIKHGDQKLWFLARRLCP